ncbi:MAG: tetratricopeptide repeat protein [Cyclobacteriaceae bacterium]
MSTQNSISKFLTGVIIILLFTLQGCSVDRKNFFSQTYHNITAKYNAYFLAREEMMEVQKAIKENHQPNYNKILKIYPDIDSTVISSQKEAIEDIIKKASIAIQRHKNSKWVDDSYILIGQSRFLNAEFPSAIETFKYVNVNSEDDNARHQALISLMRTFIHYNEYANATYVSDFLKKEKLNKENTKNLALTRAYFFQLNDDLDNMIKNLMIAAPLMKKKEGKAKIYFILGQIFQQLGFDAEAHNRYSTCLSNNPGYELSFYAKLNMAQVTELGASSDVKKVRKYFKKLLKDKKNEEFRDKIFYEIAEFEMKQENVEAAVNNYRESIATSVSNPRQKSYSYLRLGEIYYDHYKEYETAKAYYDSVVSVMPEDDDRYLAVQERQEILANFVEQITTIQEQDSLLSLASYDSLQLMAFIDNHIAEKERLAQEAKEIAAKEKNKTDNFNNFAQQQNEDFSINDQIKGTQWYFYNSSAVSLGRSEFIRKWGNRPLEDNWRRSKKERSNDFEEENTNTIASSAPPESPGANQQEAATNTDDDKNAIYQQLRMSEEQKQEALSKVETAHFKLGNIYNFQLNEKINAVETFDTLITRFPQSEYKPEALYQLYLILKGLNDPAYNKYVKQLTSEYPNSLYAKLISNPNYREESNAISEQLKKVYKKAYNLFLSDSLQQAQALITPVLREHPDNQFSDHLRLLNILITGKTSGMYNYQYALTQFLEKYPDSELAPYANKLLESIENYKVELAKKEGVKFSTNFDQTHYFVLIYDPADKISETCISTVNSFLQEHHNQAGFKTSNLILDENNSMILVNEFENKNNAMEFYEQFNQLPGPLNNLENYKTLNFVISRENFKMLYSTKGLNYYVNFFKKHYQEVRAQK